MSRRTGVQWMHSIVCIYNDTHQKVAVMLRLRVLVLEGDPWCKKHKCLGKTGTCCKNEYHPPLG